MITFRPSNEYSIAIEQARNDLQAWWNLRGKVRQKLAGWADEELATMLRDREATIQFLDSENKNIRLAAATLIADYWPGHECFAAPALRLAFGDQEASVRGAALVALQQLRQHISDPSGILRKLLSELMPGPPEQVVTDVLRQLQDGTSSMEAAKRKAWEDAAGVHATQMRESRSATESFLTHADPKVRCAALLALDMHEMSIVEQASVCESLILNDTESSVRSLAIAMLSGCYEDTDDKRAGDFIARLMCDASNSHEVRRSAYLALYGIRGMPLQAFTDADSAQFPEEVDWPFVRSFLLDS